MNARLLYALAVAALFAVEVAIALFAHDRIVRPYVGDALAVVLVYLALRAVTSLAVRNAVAIALAIACAIEVSQYLHLVDRIGLGGIPFAETVLGTGFDWNDFLAYSAGAILVLVLERLRTSQ